MGGMGSVYGSLMNSVCYIFFLVLLTSSLGFSFPIQWAFNEEPSNRENLLRDVEVGKLNFIHTTDTHGWYGSHVNQRDYDANWGDLVSFVSKFRENRLQGDQDLILIDTGDKTDGNGLSDTTSPIGLNTTDIFNEMDYDLLTLGNHELYRPLGTAQEYYKTAMSEKFKDKYVSSNVEFVTDEGEVVPFGNKYVYFETKNTKTKILAMSFLFNYVTYNPRAKVTPALKELQEKAWFQQVLKSYPESSIDMIVVFGHMPVTDVQNREINNLHAFLREHYPNIVIQYFGGHSHIRDFTVLDSKSTGLQSGRFAETVGFLSIDDVHSDDPNFFRRYIDFNKRSFIYHSNVSRKEKFSTPKGRFVTQMVDNLRKALNLDEIFGFVPKTYYFSSRPINSEESIYHLLKSKVLSGLKPDTKVNSIDNGRFIMINTGSVRYDLVKGPFSKDTEFIVLPFESEWQYIELPFKIASKIEDFLNSGPYIATLGPPRSKFINSRCSETVNSCPFINNPVLTEGYTTSDSFGCKGDDTKHNSLHEYNIPNVIQHIDVNENISDEETVKFVYYSFMQRSVLEAVNSIDKVKTRLYSEGDCKTYGGKSTRLLLREYIQNL
ncbi:hypothetical protein Kpol_1000p16 [Vanderwaltozyma polyspora DSM 70294]|uniref:Uncharacterized protein n=1 Tax=Vanderwaltozyma polyspora (strain ATCC 22028 / DSM 70294 / BCRC 21397 / CBS 2163 / NBRC 10782 / NRRL Y-8283 / UCD 57-17) TaxID=436907 RepID=A7TPV6_VANPO|nr:uncharacterized protein Kpol_1000p16 [Vanderwaltozyma polyspora DSM 70294]EDO15704.1 hypothetical protein Kpol_1000p16 [Vanderwaltozyma polyspora DSM 70294]